MASRRSSVSAVGMARAPEGFVRVGAVADAPWFVLETGNVLQGKLLGVFTREDKRSKTGKSKFFQVELSEPCRVREGRGEDAIIREGVSGEIVNLNYTPLTKMLEDNCREILAGAEYDVYAPVGKKKDLANGNTMWLIDTHVKQLKKARVEESDFGPEPVEETSNEAAE